MRSQDSGLPESSSEGGHFPVPPAILKYLRANGPPIPGSLVTVGLQLGDDPLDRGSVRTVPGGLGGAELGLGLSLCPGSPAG